MQANSVAVSKPKIFATADAGVVGAGIEIQAEQKNSCQMARAYVGYLMHLS